MGGHSGHYKEFWDHAREKRAQQVMNDFLRSVQQHTEEDHVLPLRRVQPLVNLNAAVMWHYADRLATPELLEEVIKGYNRF